MRTYVIQLKTLSGAQAEVCQANNITEALKFLMEKYKGTMGKIEYIYSEEYNEQYTNEKNTNNT